MKHRYFLILFIIFSAIVLISCNRENNREKTIQNNETTKSSQNIVTSSNVDSTANKEDNSQSPEPVPVSSETQLTATQKALSNLGFQLPQKELASIDFELEDLKGKKISLSSFKGKIVFLNFWATWCPPCRAEIASMQELYERYQSKGLEIVGVDLQEDKKLVEDFVKKYKMTYTVLLDTTGRIGQIYGARSIPTSYIIDRQGMIMARTIGGREWNTDEIFNLFSEILKK